MKKKNLFPLLLLTFLTLILGSCAKQSAPSGGPKDTIPPILIKSIPHQKKLNYKAQNLELTFSEFIALNNPKEQIIITPTVGKDYKITSKKKTVNLEFERPLKQNTTYTVNFRESIQDITEKNPTKNLQLAFSTGTYIDSLSIQGNVEDILTATKLKEATVALYETDTFNIFKNKPTYFTKTNDKGEFKIENLKNGQYLIYAFDDKNKNLIVDSKSESYGFKASPFTLDKNLKDLKIATTRLDSRPLKISSARPSNNYFVIKASKSITKYHISSDSTHITSSFGDEPSTIRIYNKLNLQDSLKINITMQDSIENKLDSSVYIKFNSKNKDVTKEKFTTTLTALEIDQSKGSIKANVKFTKPIERVNYDSAFITIDSATVLPITTNDLVWNSNKTELTVSKIIDKTLLKHTEPNQPQQNNLQGQKRKTPPTKKLALKKGTFISVENDSSSALEEQLKILPEEQTATLLIKVNTTENNFILQLLDKNFNVLKSVKNTKEIKFDHLTPSAYLLRLIIDQNTDGNWTPGNFMKKQEPEPIILYKTEKGDATINLKANWEVGPLLITY